MGYTNSSLVTYKNISPNKTSPRNHAIDTITIHCVVGQWTAKQGCDYFAKASVKASPNYIVGKDGSIGLCVEEKDRSWCSSNASNDHRAITIEVASDTTHPYAVTDKALESLIELISDICKRNGIKELKWQADKSLIGQVDKQNMTVHRWFANKSCPGDYLYNKHSYIAEQVNKKLGVSITTTTTATTSTTSRNYLMKGDKGAEVKKMQENLIYLGYSCGKAGADGDFGSGTDNAVRAFQKANGLTIDGKYGAKSKAKLEELVANKKKAFTTVTSTYTKTQFIKDIQKAIGVTVDGIVGNKTLGALVTVSKSKNNRHAVVKPLQKYLNALGYNCGTVDGIAGSKFDSAAKAWAKANGCVADGEFTKGGKSWRKILGVA